jgi:hypothetical protein
MPQLLFRVATSFLLLIATMTAQQATPFAFRDLRLGMPISEFHAKHPGGSNEVSDLSSSSLLRHLTQATCVRGTGGPRMAGAETHGVVRCNYKVPIEKIVSLIHMNAYSVSTIFVDGRLAVIEVEPPTNTNICFERPPTPGSDGFQMFATACDRFRDLLQNITDSVAKAGPVSTVADNRYQLPLLRWDNGRSVAQLEAEMCGPWNNADSGWANAMSELLAGTYCGSLDSVSSSQPVMLYVHKELGRSLVQQLSR